LVLYILLKPTEVEVVEDVVEEWVMEEWVMEEWVMGEWVMGEEEDLVVVGDEDSVIIPDLLIMDMEEEMGHTITITTKSRYIIPHRNTTIRHIITIIQYK
jgi:hypothetical protein